MKPVLKVLTACTIVIVGYVLWLTGQAGNAPAQVRWEGRVEAGGPITATVYLPLLRRDFVPPVDIGISRVEVIQGVTMSNAYRVHIANRATTLRVFPSFASTNGSTSVGNVNARLTCNGATTVDAGPITVVQSPNEGNLNHTLNFNLPAGCLTPGAVYNIQIDFAGAVAEYNEGNNRWPAVGDTSFNYVNPDPVKVMFVPIDYRPQGCGGPSYLPDTSTQNYLTWYPSKVWPAHTITYFNWHAPLQHCQLVADNGMGWSELLNAVTTLHNIEGNSDTLYYGVINVVGAGQCGGGCVAGLGWLGVPTAVGFSGFGAGQNTASTTFTHEAGHNFDRSHTPGCEALGTDPGYPASYIDGLGRATIGQYGLDVSNGTLYAPASNFDYMSYCGPEWTSDYTYKAIYDFRQVNPWLINRADQQDALALSGGFDADGNAQVWTVSRQAAIIRPAEATGTHRAELLDARGNVLTSRAFTPTRMEGDVTGPEGLVSGFELSGFQVAVPMVEGVAGLRIYEGERLVFERTAPSPAPELTLVNTTLAGEGASVRWRLTAGAAETVYHVRFSPDGGQTWTVLAINATASSLNIPANLLIGATRPVVEVQATDGVRVTLLTIELP